MSVLSKYLLWDKEGVKMGNDNNATIFHTVELMICFGTISIASRITYSRDLFVFNK